MNGQNECELYTCMACQYTFESPEMPDQCPDCGKTEVRPATELEQAEYLSNHGRPIERAAQDHDPSQTTAETELERVLAILRPYLQETLLLDVVRSDKYGYLLISLPYEGMIEDSTLTQLDSAEKLVAEVYQNLRYDYVEQFGDIESFEKASPAEAGAMREWMRKYTDQLPEYDRILDDVLGNAGSGAIRAMERLSAEAERNGTSEMSLDEINAEIDAARKERERKKGTS